LKLVALGVTAKIIMVVQQQDARPGRGSRPKKMRGRKTADAGADHDQIVRLAGIDTLRPSGSISQRMRTLERARMATPHAIQERRVITGQVLGGNRSSNGIRRMGLEQWAGQCRRTGNQRTLQKIAAWNGALLTELATHATGIALAIDTTAATASSLLIMLGHAYPRDTDSCVRKVYSAGRPIRYCVESIIDYYDAPSATAV
jgi:hypothetical protein